MLNVLLPMTLPTAMSRSPLMAAAIEVATSGSEVPAATMVSPITRSLTPSALANVTAASTSHCDPSTRAARPASTSPSCTSGERSQVAVAAGPNASVYSSCAARVWRRDCTTRKMV